MSDTSSPLDSLFETQRNLIDRSIETQEKLNRQGLDLTRQAMSPLVGAAGEDAEAQLEDAFDHLEDAQAELFEDLQEAAERGVDASEDVTGWSVDLFEEPFEGLREASEAVETEVEAAADETVDAAEPVADEATDAAEPVADETADADEAESAPVVDIDGIGKTYSARLEDAGISTRGDLATTSAEEVAAAAGVSEDRAGEWVQRAQEQA